MANLIPPAARKKVKTQYWFRVASVWMFLVATACLMVSLLQLPAYVLVSGQLEAFDESFKEAAKDNEEFTFSKAAIERSTEIGLVLKSQHENSGFSEVINALENMTNDEVEIYTFKVLREEGKISVITISGQAKSRTSLADFKNTIESNQLFETAILPLSNLAKDKDIPFQISIEPSVVNEV